MERKRLKAVRVFNAELKKTSNLINGILVSNYALEKLMAARGLSKEDISVKTSKILASLLDFGEEKKEGVYELGFIRAFAAFEKFMYDLLLELYKKFPEAIPYERKIEVSDIINYNSRKSIVDFVIDQIAVENSYDVNAWEKTLVRSFKIYPFKNSEEKKDFMTVNLFRNMVLHSGRKMNSKVIKDFTKHLEESSESPFKREKFVVEKFDLPMYEIWYATLIVTYRVASNIKNHFAR